ncbi:hypothetical protein [Halodesulfovibrio marinisediminis]|uniref:Uncharacterized protein n=1 Tax=Halodesulfovibrio marinisediminis DSM 17456 TaxID=1121457 RepID=A0A1N6I144_9BACT|nr:hypothetical protein [Halodesulfovibrio marinisediminis]SIO25756.1 hypothetical protein SAMN02745161_2334 [Halodesulfovibrio marinisediminis DSM 17456]
MRVSVIASEKLVSVGGTPFNLQELSFDEYLHAIQFDGQHGHIEFKTSDGGVNTAPVSEFEVQPYVDAWKAEKVRLEAKAAVQAETELAQQRIAEIQQELTANGLASLHPLRAKVAGTATSEDEAKLVELDEQAKTLQTELAALSAN